MTFEEFLISKKIDATSFKNEESKTFKEWESLYQSVHPDSFVAQKKFHINPIRRRFGLPN
jgi:hypothetical protein